MKLEDIDLLLGLFRRLLELLNSVLPEKDPDKWATAKKEAEIKLGQDMDRRKSMFTARPTKKPKTISPTGPHPQWLAEQIKKIRQEPSLRLDPPSEAERKEMGWGPRKKSQEEISREKATKEYIAIHAERIYRQMDGDYAKSVANIVEEADSIVSQLKHLLRPFRELLLEWTQLDNPMIYKKGFFTEYWPENSKENKDYYIAEAIEDLKGMKFVMEQQQAVNATQEQTNRRDSTDSTTDVPVEAGPAATKVEWSRPMGLKQLSDIFGLHPNTMKKWLAAGQITNEHISSRRWRIDIQELPADMVKRVRANSKKK